MASNDPSKGRPVFAARTVGAATPGEPHRTVHCATSRRGSRSRDSSGNLATHDALTGLYNRAYLDTECERLDRGRAHPIGVLVADADGLKRVNDLLGHHAGDALLCRSAAVLASSFRGDDVIARAGGDEFVVLLPGHDAAAVLRARERLDAAVRVHAVRSPISISVGDALCVAGEPVRDALRRADQAMLVQKHRRRAGREP